MFGPENSYPLGPPSLSLLDFVLYNQFQFMNCGLAKKEREWERERERKWAAQKLCSSEYCQVKRVKVSGPLWVCVCGGNIFPSWMNVCSSECLCYDFCCFFASKFSGSLLFCGSGGERERIELFHHDSKDILFLLLLLLLFSSKAFLNVGQ